MSNTSTSAADAGEQNEAKADAGPRASDTVIASAGDYEGINILRRRRRVKSSRSSIAWTVPSTAVHQFRTHLPRANKADRRICGGAADSSGVLFSTNIREEGVEGRGDIVKN